jgi:hypothetical protein
MDCIGIPSWTEEFRSKIRMSRLFLLSSGGAASSSFVAHIERQPLHRGASASKKNCLAGPFHPFQTRYILRHPWTGSDESPVATAHRQQLSERHEREAPTLATLTCWNTGDIRRTMNVETASAPIKKKWYRCGLQGTCDGISRSGIVQSINNQWSRPYHTEEVFQCDRLLFGHCS